MVINLATRKYQRMSQKVVILFGSKVDVDFAKPLRRTLQEFGINFDQWITSAHKTPKKVLEILREYEKSEDELIYITVAGRSNALSGVVDANTKFPVIACPPCSERLSIDIYSSLRMPSGVAPLVLLDPEAAALAAAKILALDNEKLSKKITNYQSQMKKKIEANNKTLRRKN